MDFTGIKSLTIPEGSVKKITAGGVVLWEKITAIKNWVKFSTEADGVTIYNNGLGYKDGYRVRSSGAEGALDTASCTGYIPFTKSDKLYIYPPFFGKNNDNAITFFDASFTCLGHITDSGSAYGICSGNVAMFKTTVVDGVSVLDLSDVTASGVENIAYVRVTNYINASAGIIGADMIITKNEEIPL